MRTIIRIGIGVSILAAGAFGARGGVAEASIRIGPDVRVSGATAEQIDLGRWAVRRFEAAGLEPPSVEIEFHPDRSGCEGNIGFARGGEVDVCGPLVDAMGRRIILHDRRIILHEMSHIWLDENVDASERERFLALRNLPSWNASSDPWRLRGYEQGAEIMAWALDNRVVVPQIPYFGSEELEVAFELLTGVEAPVGQGGWPTKDGGHLMLFATNPAIYPPWRLQRGRSRVPRYRNQRGWEYSRRADTILVAGAESSAITSRAALDDLPDRRRAEARA